MNGERKRLSQVALEKNNMRRLSLNEEKTGVSGVTFKRCFDKEKACGQLLQHALPVQHGALTLLYQIMTNDKAALKAEEIPNIMKNSFCHWLAA